MHEYLRHCIGILREFWENDSRSVAFAMNGSGGRSADDEWSDADVLLVVRDEAFSSVRADIRGLMERLCGQIKIWLPDGESDRCVNYAFLFEKDGEQFLMDHAVFCDSCISESPYCEAGVIFFDRSGELTRADKRFMDRGTEVDIARLVDTYLVYTYLNGKYYRRKDTAKLLYIQNTLQGLHMKVLSVLYPGHKFSGWPAGDFHFLSDEHQKAILEYANAPNREEIARHIMSELNNFRNDAQAACKAAALPYPEEGDRFVLRQLIDAGLPAAPPSDILNF